MIVRGLAKDEAALRTMVAGEPVRDMVEGLARLTFEVDGDATAIRDAARASSLDIAVLDASIDRPGWLVFDADSTLVDAEGIDELAARAGVGEEVAAITEAAMRGELDYEESLRDRTRRLAGLPYSEVEAVAASLPLTPGAVDVVATARKRGWKIAVVSGGFLPLVGAVASRLALDHAAAHRLEVRDGRLTGEIEGEIVDAVAKATIARSLRGDLPLIGCGDGANDVPLLREADVAVSFCAKPVLEAEADVLVRTKDLRVGFALAVDA